MRIYVGGLSFQTSESQLADFFAAYSPQSVRIITDRETGESRGFGFVEIADAALANRAIAAVNGTELGGRTLQVNEARERADRGPSRGGASRPTGRRAW
jgi:RNA recognition motif-containing protein